MLHLVEGRIDDAIAALEAAHARFIVLHDDAYRVLSIGALAEASLAGGDVDGAIGWGAEWARSQHALGDISSTVVSLRAAAYVWLAAGRFDEAATVAGAFEALCSRYGIRPPADPLDDLLQPLPAEHALALRGGGHYAEAASRGAAMSIDEAADYVLEVAEELLAAASSHGMPPDEPTAIA